jgi:hypothetical protein
MTPPDPLTALGSVEPPPPDVLDAAREALWSAITHEMLTTAPSAGQTTRTTAPSAGQTTRHLSPEPGVRRQRSGPPDPGT